MQSVGTLDHTHIPVKEQVHALIDDLNHEVVREMHHDNTQSDVLVRKHVMGLIIILFALVGLILLAGIAAVALFYHPHIVGYGLM